MEKLRKVCNNAWCKATFYFTESDMIIEKNSSDVEIRIEPPFCPKCISFDNDLSGGVKWEDRRYEDDPKWDGPIQMKYKVTNFSK
jgi:hypothetical protein